MALKAFIDDSADGRRNHILVLAGYVASAETWAAFSKAWDAHLQALRIDAFKLSEFPRSKPEIIASFYRIIEDYNVLTSVEFTLDIHAFRRQLKIYESHPLYPRLQPLIGNPYHFAYKAMGAVFIGAERIGLTEPVDIIFDEQLAEMPYVLMGWNSFQSTIGDQFKPFVGNAPLFLNDKTTLPLQAADLLAGYLRKAVQKGTYSKTDETGIFPWECRNPFYRVIPNSSEAAIANEFKWLFSLENQQRTIDLAREQMLFSQPL